MTMEVTDDQTKTNYFFFSQASRCELTTFQSPPPNNSKDSAQLLQASYKADKVDYKSHYNKKKKKVSRKDTGKLHKKSRNYSC